MLTRSHLPVLLNIHYSGPSLNNRHFGVQASVLYLGYVLYWGVLVKAPPTQPYLTIYHYFVNQYHMQSVVSVFEVGFVTPKP